VGTWSLEYGSFGCLVGYLEERNRPIFEDKALPFQDKLYFLMWLYSWSVGLNGNKIANFEFL